MRKPVTGKVLATGRARAAGTARATSRALGLPTRGTTNPNRLRRVDRWIAGTQASRLRDATDPLVIDLGYGHLPITTLELAERLRGVRPDLRLLGLELDAGRVAAAQPLADPPAVEFARGGFELAGRHPVLVRAMNVLRQYPVDAVAEAWRTMTERLAPGGLLVEGSCDELGRLACWVALDSTGPLTLSLSARLSSLERPSDLAERLPKALIHRNVPGDPIHTLFTALDHAWAVSSPLSNFGPRQRWMDTAQRMLDDGWPVVGGRQRWRLGELTIRWSAVDQPVPTGG
jgi:hypothetical protein